jgi:hypothetical protein
MQDFENPRLDLLMNRSKRLNSGLQIVFEQDLHAPLFGDLPRVNI